MNRIFHARIAWYQYFLLAVVAVNACGFLWCKNILLATVLMLLLIVIIEQVIHTTYTVTTEGDLILSYGRFIRRKVIPIREITEMRKCSSMKVGRFAVTQYVLIEYSHGKYATVLPVKEQEFVATLNRRMQEINSEIH